MTGAHQPITRRSTRSTCGDDARRARGEYLLNGVVRKRMPRCAQARLPPATASVLSSLVNPLHSPPPKGTKTTMRRGCKGRMPAMRNEYRNGTRTTTPTIIQQRSAYSRQHHHAQHRNSRETGNVGSLTRYKKCLTLSGTSRSPSSDDGW